MAPDVGCMDANEVASGSDICRRLLTPADVDAAACECAGYVATLEEAKGRYGSLA